MYCNTLLQNQRRTSYGLSDSTSTKSSWQPNNEYVCVGVNVSLF